MSTAELAMALPAPAAAPEMLRFRGRAVMTWNAADTNRISIEALRRACDPGRMTAERVAAYCERTGRDSAPFERAVLREAVRVIAHDALVERIAAPLAGAGGVESLGVRLRGRGQLRGSRLVARVRSASSIGEGIDVDLERADVRTGTTCPFPGRLRVEGVVRSGSVEQTVGHRWTIVAGRELEPGGPGRTAADAITSLAGSVALSRLGEAIAWRLRTQLDAACEAPLLLAMSAPIGARTYRLYWRRLRDYLIWCASHDV